MMRSVVKPVEFKFNDYLSKGLELIKKDFGNFILAYFFCMIMAIIPLCGLLAMGNFYKYCKKLDRGEMVGAGEIFNFDDFMPYFILQLIIIGGFFALYIPFFIFIPMAGLLGGIGGGNEASSVFMVLFMFLYLAAFIFAIFYFALKGFYIPGLISLNKTTDIKTAWNMSKVMTKNNLLLIFLFAIVVCFLAQLGVLACGIGLLVTMPYYYTTHYFAFEDAIQQIGYDEIKEIGLKEKDE
ncbi:hypothetical protein [Chryseobacterium sp.]|uniref:hypothetical protein n=1 Tax=Chryseobacterium sp. TaxID=1871047 RepID=UPI0025B92E78|nr:hypothetical protein [Chryseobacterium sp.]